MQMQEIKLEEIEPTIRKIFAAGGDFTFYPKGTSMHPFVEQGRDKITLAPISDQVRKYEVILYKRKNGAFVLHRVVCERVWHKKRTDDREDDGNHPQRRSDPGG